MNEYGWRLSVKYDPGQPRVPAGESRGGQWTSGVIPGQPVDYKPIERVYHGRRIDAELEDDYLDELNGIPGITVTSTCAGHTKLTETQGAGGSEHPGFNFDHNWITDPERIWSVFKDLPDTTVDVNAWSGPFANWVTWVNGEWRYDVFSDRASPEQLRAMPIKKINVSIDSTIEATKTNKAERDAWWRKTVPMVRKIVEDLNRQ